MLPLPVYGCKILLHDGGAGVCLYGVAFPSLSYHMFLDAAEPGLETEYNHELA